MLSVFKLAEAMNEAATGMFQSNVEPYEFMGTLEESSAEMNYILMSEQANMEEFLVGAEEIMTEAAMSNPDALDTICENVLENLTSGLKKFIDKLIAMVKGVIAKLKAFFFKFTGKTDKWLSVMEPRINAAKPGAENATTERHLWDVDYVIDGMAKGLLGSMKTGESSVNNDLKSYKDLKSTAESEIKAGRGDFAKAKTQGKDIDSKEVKAAMNNKTSALNKFKATVEDFENTWNDTLLSESAKHFGVSGGSSLEDMWTNVAKKVYKGTLEKKTVSVKDAGGVQALKESVKNSKDAIKKLQDAYDEHIKALQKIRSDVEGLTDSKSSTITAEDKYAGEFVNTYKSLVSKYCSLISKKLSGVEGVMTTARGKNVAWVQEMVSENMNSITAYCNYKGEKK